MRIHTDKLTPDHLTGAAADMPGVRQEIDLRGSRKRARAYEVKMVGKPGKDRHGITRMFSTGGAYGTADGIHRALTWVEWGDWMVELLKIDPGAIIGNYAGAHDFIIQTSEASYDRPERENAADHVERWSRELYAAAESDKQIMRDPYRPIEERRAAFRRQNVRSGCR